MHSVNWKLAVIISLAALGGCKSAVDYYAPEHLVQMLLNDNSEHITFSTPFHDDEVLKLLVQKNRHLKSITFVSTGVTSKGIAYLKDAKKLEAFNWISSNSKEGFTNEHFEQMCKLTTLIKISVPFWHLDSKSLNHLGELPSLVELGIYRNKIKPEDLAPLNELKNLKRIRIYPNSRLFNQELIRKALSDKEIIFVTLG